MLKDEFAQFWGFTYQGAAEKFLRTWMTSALRSRIPSLSTFVGTLKTHFDNILVFVEHDLTNAVAEGFNRIIKIVKNRASGYRNLDAFTDIIYTSSSVTSISLRTFRESCEHSDVIDHAGNPALSMPDAFWEIRI